MIMRRTQQVALQAVAVVVEERVFRFVRRRRAEWEEEGVREGGQEDREEGQEEGEEEG